MAKELLTNLDANGNKIIDLGTPTTNTDAATKQYVDDNAGTPIPQQPDAPSSPVEDDLWLDTDEGVNPGSVGLSSLIGYVEVTANQIGISTSWTDITGLSINVTVPAGRRIRVSAQILVQHKTTAGTDWIGIFEGADQLSEDVTTRAVDEYGTPAFSVILSPSAGAHTYKLRGLVSAGTFNSIAGPDDPAFILVEDITGTLWPAGQSIGAGAIASEEWTDYVPTLTASTTSPTLGTASVAVGKYIKTGRTVIGRAIINFGTSGVAAGSGQYRISLPVMPTNHVAASGGRMVGSALLWDNSVTNVDIGVVWIPGNVQYANINTDAVGVTDALPWVWAASDSLEICFTYEAAS